MRILFASSEVQPLIKTGGLADVSGSLPKALADASHDVRIVLPGYRNVLQKMSNASLVAMLEFPALNNSVRIWQSELPGTTIPLYIIDAPEYFDRPGNPYQGPDKSDWPDNAERFTAFCHSIVALAMNQTRLDWQPDIVHCNDWQTGLVPALLSQFPQRPATLFTIHNLAYQGCFNEEVFWQLKLPGSLWHMNGVEFYGGFSFIKGGIAYADKITTVSPTYAEEIQRPEYGHGLEGLLQSRQADLHGILNGVDYEEWNPKNDRHLPQHYHEKTFDKKLVNKKALQQLVGLPQNAETPLLGFVGRLVSQKGIDLIVQAAPRLLEQGVQLVLLGSGDAHFEQALNQLSQRYPAQVSVTIGYSEMLAHLIEAGSDMFLMPSRYEPCGLNQLYSLKYGTPPVVHETGGLADSVVNVSRESLKKRSATGFTFVQLTADALADAIERGLDLYHDQKQWYALCKQGMRQDFSWQQSANHYIALYQQLSERKTASNISRQAAGN